jgi:hypothetical protein
MEISVAAALMDALHDIAQTRRALSQLSVRTRLPELGSAIVWDQELETATWAVGDAQIGAAAKHGRPVRVILVGNRLVEVMRSVDRLIVDHGGEP